MKQATTSEVAAHVLDRIAGAEVQSEPFPHVIVPDIFPPDFYAELIANFPDRASFQKVTYPGTGHGRRSAHYRDYGFACKDFADLECFGEVAAILRSDEFARALLDKFGSRQPDGSQPIPAAKHEFFRDGAHEFATVFDLQVDLPGYELPPHADVDEKIVTFQFYLEPDDELGEFGTLLCRPKSGATTTRRSKVASAAGELITLIARGLRLDNSRPSMTLLHSRVGLKLGVGTTRSWLPWGLFDVAKIGPALPNHFLAFAPNERSYHAVRLDIPADKRQERRVVRGFIRAGRNTQNWIQAEE